MPRFLVFFFVFFSTSGFAQVVDYFDDGDLTNNPVWYGNVQYFKDTNSVLQSRCKVPNTSFYLSAPIHVSSEMSWRLKGKLLFNTSSLNYLDFILLSDSLNFNNTKNRLLIRLGGSQDDLSVIKMSNGVETKCIDGIDNAFNRSVNSFELQVELMDDSLFIRHFNLSDSSVTEYNTFLSTNSEGNFCGIKIRQSTSSFFEKHYLDFIYAGDLIRDTLSPLLNSIAYKGHHVVSFQFNESVQLLDTQSVKLFLMDTISCKIKNQIPSTNPTEFLVFLPCLRENELQTFVLDSIYDMSLNKIKRTIVDFIPLKGSLPAKEDIIINELMVDPEPSAGLMNKEYVELFNRSDKFITLDSLFICDRQSCRVLQSHILYPDSFYLVYDVPSMNNSDDHIQLKDKNGTTIHEVTYTDKWYRDELKGQGGYSLELIDPYNLCLAEKNWSASTDTLGGTPGIINSIHRLTNKDVNPPMLDDHQFVHPNQLKLHFSEGFDSVGIENWNILVDTKNVHFEILKLDKNAGYIQVRFDTIFSPDSIYYFKINGLKDCDGNLDSFYFFESKPAISPYPKDLVFNEVLFNPKTGSKDFIELYNRSNRVLNLNRTYLLDLNPSNSGKLLKLSDSFNSLLPYQYLLISIDTGQICKDYKCSEYPRKMLQLKEMPVMPDEGVSLLLVNENFEFVDSLVCNENWHFDLLEDKNGVSLERINPDFLEMSESNWTSASFSSGFGTPTYANSQLFRFKNVDDCFTLHNSSVSPDNDGFEDLLIWGYKLPAPNYLLSMKIFSSDGFLVAEPYNNYSAGTEGLLNWNGLNDQNESLLEGVYLIVISGNSPNLKPIQQNFTVVLRCSNN